jgi:hypothetical protein
VVGDAVSDGFGVMRAVDFNHTDAETADRGGSLFSNEEVPVEPFCWGSPAARRPVWDHIATALSADAVLIWPTELDEAIAFLCKTLARRPRLCGLLLGSWMWSWSGPSVESATGRVLGV